MKCKIYNFTQVEGTCGNIMTWWISVNLWKEALTGTSDRNLQKN